MSTSADATRLLPLVREYGRLERKRITGGVTPSEYSRWSDLRTLLEKKFPQGQRPQDAERRATLRLPTKMLVEFTTEGDLQAALIRNISRGGLFIVTPISIPVGTELRLEIRVGQDERIELPVEVASSQVPGPDGETGIGCKFAALDATQRSIVDEMFATALDSDI